MTTTPAVADLHIDTLTTPSGFGLSQNGVPIPLEPYDAAYGATLAPGPFTLTLNGDVLERVAVMFGYGFFFSHLNVYPETLPFSVTTVYARWPDRPMTEHFMTDATCVDETDPPGYNLLLPLDEANGGYLVDALFVDNASRSCAAEGRLPQDTNLLERGATLFLVVITDAGDTYLTLEFEK